MPTEMQAAVKMMCVCVRITIRVVVRFCRHMCKSELLMIFARPNTSYKTICKALSSHYVSFLGKGSVNMRCLRIKSYHQKKEVSAEK